MEGRGRRRWRGRVRECGEGRGVWGGGGGEGGEGLRANLGSDFKHL